MIPGNPQFHKSGADIIVVPGNVLYTAPGVYYFTVPTFNQIAIELLGAGGGGGMSFYGESDAPGYAGAASQCSTISMYAGGGAGGGSAANAYGTNGASGVASGGDVMLYGSLNSTGYGMNAPGPYAGTGGAPVASPGPSGGTANAGNGGYPGAGGGGAAGNFVNTGLWGGGGGAGAYCKRTLTEGQIAVGLVLVISVGNGGPGRNIYRPPIFGSGEITINSGSGAGGYAAIAWS